MRLYLSAENKTEIKYTPDWIQMTVDNKEMTFDIQGWIDYGEGLQCRCKADLVPWVLCDLDNDDEIDLYDIEDYNLTPTEIYDWFEKGRDFLVGVYPQEPNDLETEEDYKMFWDKVHDDKFGVGDGEFDIMVDGELKQFEFNFEVEFNDQKGRYKYELQRNRTEVK